MLPRRLRLPRAGFAAQNAGKRLTSSHLSMSVAEARPKAGGVAFIISKKVAPTAVARHRVKRQVLAVLKPYAQQSLAIAVHARTGAAGLRPAALRAELLDLIKKSGLPRA